APSTRSTSADTREVRSRNRDPSIYSPGRGGGIKCPLLYSSPETQKKSAEHPAQPRPPQQPNSPHRRTAPQEVARLGKAKGEQQFGQGAQKSEAQQSGERGPSTSSPSTDPPHSRITHPKRPVVPKEIARPIEPRALLNEVSWHTRCVTGGANNCIPSAQAQK
ncbi:hypothetical protein TcG_10848, partial [Trypanosoma cruzi]